MKSVIDLAQRIERLYIDKAFGILTRNALEIEVEEQLTPPFDVAIIDFKNVKLLNSTIGYDRLNTLFKSMFETFSYSEPVLIGRWFSGDEIALVCKTDIAQVITEFTKHAEKHALSFRGIMFYNQSSLNDLKMDGIGDIR